MDKEYGRFQRDVVTVRLDESEYMDYQNSITIGSSSIIGTRKNQQDSYYIGYGELQSIAAVCDGMGGMEGGEIASQTAASGLAEDFAKEFVTDIPAFLAAEAVKLDQMVYNLTNGEGQRMNGGTTMVAVVVQGNRLYYLSVGDSRIYILRGDEMVQVNRDHNFKLRLDMQLKNGQINEEEYVGKMNQGEALISYLGMGDVSLMDVNQEPFILNDGDVVLLCSDGLYKRLPEPDIREIIKRELPDVDKAACELTNTVMERTTKSQDNTTVILVQYNQYSIQ